MSESGKIFNFTRPPVLLIGSGISKRYLENHLDWEDLLKSVAEKIGIDEKVFPAYIAKSTTSGSPADLPAVASELRIKLLDGITSGELDPVELYSEKEFERYNDGVDPFKILVASLCKNEKIKTDKKTLDEMESFRKLRGVVPGIITTNYDRFLEMEVFPDFKIYSDVSNYYFSDSEGIGEIYKVHGTATIPDTLIVTEEDYEKLDDKSKLVTSKILSILCDYPLVILGYSMSDDNVKKLVHDLMSSLDESKLQEIGKNIIYVEYLKGEDDIVRKHKMFNFEDKTLFISTIGTDNFKNIFDELGSLTPSMSPIAIRKTRQMVRRIVLSEDVSEYVSLIGVNRIDDLSIDKLVIAFADKDSMLRMKKFYLNF